MSESSDNTYSLDLLKLRDATFRFGTVHPAQAQQLQIWPRLAVLNSVSAEARVDLQKYEVNFYVNVKGRGPAKLTKDHLLNALNEAVKFMFGEWWLVRVWSAAKGKKTHRLIYHGAAKTKPPERKSYAGTDYEAGKIVPELPWKFQTQTQPSSK